MLKMDEYIVTPFTRAGMIGCIFVTDDKKLARSAQRQLRANYPSVKILSRDEFTKAQDDEAERRAIFL